MTNPLMVLLTVSVFQALLMVTLTCLGCLGLVVWPKQARAAEDALTAAPARCIMLGLVDLLGAILLVVVAGGGHTGVGRLLACVLLLLMWVYLLIGLSALLASLGERVLALADRPATRASSTLAGAATLAGCGLLPWVGWTVVTLALVAALGAAVLAALRKK